MKDINSYLQNSFIKNILSKSNQIRNQIDKSEICFDDDQNSINSLFSLESWVRDKNESMKLLKNSIISKYNLNGLPHKNQVVDMFIRNSKLYNRFIMKVNNLYLTIANENISNVNRSIEQVEKSNRNIFKMDYSEYSKIGYSFYLEINNVYKDLFNVSNELAQKIVVNNDLSTSNEFVRLFDCSFTNIIKDSDFLIKKITNKYKAVLESITLGFNHEEKDVNAYIGILELFKNDKNSLDNLISRELLKCQEIFQNIDNFEKEEYFKLSIKNNRKLLLAKLLSLDEIIEKNTSI